MKCDWCGREYRPLEIEQSVSVRFTQAAFTWPVRYDIICAECYNDLVGLREDIGERGPREADEGEDA